MTVCPICNGRGTVGYYDVDHFVDVECDRCHGSGEVSEVEMTNEEYLRSCNTEQLANVFFEYRYVNATPRQKLWMSASEKCIKVDIVEWLKQPHSEVEK